MGFISLPPNKDLETVRLISYLKLTTLKTLKYVHGKRLDLKIKLTKPLPNHSHPMDRIPLSKMRVLGETIKQL